MSRSDRLPVPFDPEVERALATTLPGTTPEYTAEGIPAIRASMAASFPPAAEAVGGHAVDVVERTIAGPQGADDLEVTVLRPRDRARPLPCLYNIHGGGMMIGHRNMDTGRLLELVTQLGVVAVNVEYRLAPEHPHPAPVEDCYAGLVWTVEHAAELGIDPQGVVVMGGSAGGGLCAGVALLARDRSRPAIAGQLLLCPMIDDSVSTVASHQYTELGPWTRAASLAGWSSLLGDAMGTPTVSPYAAPIRARDLSGLPPAFIEVGSAEGFRDEAVEYARRIWATGGQAELHVWGGGCHGFDIYAPNTELTRIALDTRTSWLRRVMQP